VLIDQTNARVLDVLENREKTTLVAWLKQAQERGLLGQLQEATIDMWEGYLLAVQEALGPTVRVVIDRFHVMSKFQEQMTRARRELQKALSREERDLLKGSRWLWCSNLENLTREQRKELAALKRRFPTLSKLWWHRQRLRRLFEDRRITTAEEGRRRLLEWCEQGKRLGLVALEKFNETLGRWLEGIANYFMSRSSNGRTEGFNHGIRSILWRAFGMQNFAHFRLRVLHALG